MENLALPGTTTEGTNDNLEDVRDLLFGRRTPEVSRRVPEIEPEPVENSVAEQFEPFESKIDSIENRLKSEAATRIKQGELIRRNLGQTEEALTDRIKSVEERLHKFETKIWGEVYSRYKKHNDDLANLEEELVERIGNEISAESDKSIDRTDLGDFLIDLGLKIQSTNNPAG